MAKLWRNGTGKIVRIGGIVQRCGVCPCTPSPCDCDGEGPFPEEISVTISGVTGCVDGRCADHNGTYVLGATGTNCIYELGGAIFPATDCDGAPTPLGTMVLTLLGNGTFEFQVFDQLFGPIYTQAFFSGSTAGDCDGFTGSASAPTIYSGLAPDGYCPDCTSWCDWSGASVSINAL